MFTKVFPTLVVAGLAAASFAQSKIPTELAGEWRYGTINPIHYVDKSTGAYQGHGGGTSVAFVFEKDGTVKRYVYIETNTYGWRTQVLTSTEGQAKFEGDTFRVETKIGKYKSMSNRVARHNFDRPMTDEERAKDAATVYRWSLDRDEKGETVLKIAMGSGAPTVFRRPKN